MIPQSVKRDNNKIRILRMNHPKIVSDFILAVQNGKRRGYEDYSVIIDDSSLAFPNVCVPIAGIVEYWKSIGTEFNYFFERDDGYIANSSISHPLLVSDNMLQLSRGSLNKIWKFRDFEDVQQLVDSFVREISQVSICESGVLEGLTWCLNEVMDNVLQHSKANFGYAMGQIHQSTKHIAFCVFDYGQGIYNSLKDTQYTPRHPIDAITLAVKEGITRDSDLGQGNGMWGLHNIVKVNSGRLGITSNGASYIMKGDEIKTFTKLPFLSKENGCTTVDFQVDFDKGISISEALGGYEPINLRTFSIENLQGNLVYKISEKASGTGTRNSGLRVRNELINLHRESGQVIEIDFSDVPVVSSSFADELVGKLVSTYGFFGFNQVFRLMNMNQIIQSIVNRSVAQRMSQSYVVNSRIED